MEIAHNIQKPHRAAVLLLALLAAAWTLATPDAARANAVFGSFWADLSVSKPTGLEPASGADFAFPDEHVQLSWDPVGGARKYQVQISRESSFGAGTIVITATVGTNKYVPTGLFDDGTYWWRVRAHDGGRKGTWSAKRSFDVSWGGQPTNLRFYDEDLNLASSTPLGGVLGWDHVDGASGYQVQVATAASFSSNSIMISSDNRPHNRVVLPRIPDDTYWWRVRTIDSSGHRGPWVTAPASFDVEWTSINAGAITPADGSPMHQWRLGWDPVPGAARYQVQAGTHPGCFFEPDVSNPTNRPDHSPGEDPGMPIGTIWCRISHENHTETINNWMTTELIADREIFENTELDSYTPAPPYRWTDVYWRVRPVHDLTQNKETLWDVTGTIPIRGEWSKAGANQPFHFTLGAAAPATTDGGACPSVFNPSSPGCLSTVGSTYSASDSSDNSSTMQMPLLEWEPFDHAGTACDRGVDGGADGSLATSGTAETPCYGTLVEVATDEAFDQIVWEGVIRDGKAEQASTAIFERDGNNNTSQLDVDGSTLADNEVGTGYWWRAVPCIFWGYQVEADGLDNWRCVPAYYIVGPSTAVGTPGMGARMFVKRAAFGAANQVDTIEEYAGRAPLLRWDRVHGADYYEVEVSPNSKFDSGVVSLKTTAAMVIPHRGSGKSELDNGKWWWRVRAIDANGLKSGWSVESTFTKAVDAPSLVSPSNGVSRTDPVLEWTPVEGSVRYQVEYSKNSEFTASKTKSVTTFQTAYVLNATAGTWHWRVRAYDVEGAGAWSNSRSVRVLAADELLFELNRKLVPAGKPIFVRGELYENGAPGSRQRIRLQRRVSAGSYSTVRSGTTGTSSEPGVVRLSHKPPHNAHYRLARKDGGRWHYSAPFQVLVQPKIVKATFNTKKLRRGKTFRITAKLNRRVTGKALIEYRYKGKWRVAGRKQLRRVNKFRVSGRVNRSGTFKMRLRVTKMGKYYNTGSGTTKVRINDVWTYYAK